MFHRPHVQRGLEILDQNNGEIWAKLEAGTAEYFQKIDRTTIHFEQILQNITAAAQIRPLVIQALFMIFQASLSSLFGEIWDANQGNRCLLEKRTQVDDSP